jgi:CHAT domain
MSRECIIDFRQNGDQLDLDVQAISATAAEKFKKLVKRQQLQLQPADLDRLRSGEPPAALVQQVADAVTQWLLMPDLDLPLLLKLDMDIKPPWRLVFSSENVHDETLRQGLAEVPLELVQPPGFAIPLALLSGVSSIVHRLPKTGIHPPSATTRNWPLRVLIVRSNPADLGGLVPTAEPIRAAILQARPAGFAANLIQVDVLSSEQAPGLAGRPTADQLFWQVVKPYDMLIYLGHGDVQHSPTGGPSLGVLLLETEDGRNSKQVDARQLSSLLNVNPIPVVLLVGCLTAAEIPRAIKPELEKSLPGWIRGSQGVAQALVNGQSGVQFVVGMRFKVKDQDAVVFLKEFFSRLLAGPKPGDLEAALQDARRRLHFQDAQSLGWAAPVVFRTQGEEPTFPYLASPPPPLAIPLSVKEEKLRSELWQMLCEINMQLRGKGLHGTHQKFLDTVERDYFDALAAEGSLLLPDRCEVDPNALTAGLENPVQVAICLRNPLQMDAMDGTVIVSGGKLVSLEPAPKLEASGCECFVKPPRDNRIKFHLQAEQPTTLPEGPLLKVNLTIPNEPQVVYLVSLDVIRIQPAAPLCCLSNAVIVPAP